MSISRQDGAAQPGAGDLVADYLMLRDLLPAVRPDSVDEFLWRLDERLFGLEPSLWLERLNQRPIVEWFSFFYYSYFFIAFTYMLVVIWLIRPGRLTSEFAPGTLIVFCVGQLGYLAVPGYGPSLYLESQFQGPVDGGFFWGCVVATTRSDRRWLTRSVPGFSGSVFFEQMFSVPFLN